MFTQVAAGWQPAAAWVNTTRYCKYSQVLLMMDENIAPKHVEPTWNNKLIYIVHLVGYFHSCITMHGFIYVKSESHVGFVITTQKKKKMKDSW